MKRNLLNSFLIMILAFAGSYAHAQILPIGYDTLDRSHEIIIDAGLDYYGSAVENDLTSKFIFGGLLTEEIKESSFNRHGNVNRFGGIGFGDIEYRNYTKKLFKKKNWGFQVKAGYNVFAGVLYSKDLYGLALYGNENYMGTTMDMSGTDISMMVYQKVGFGFVNAKTKSAISLNVYNISDRVSADFRTLELTQDENGDELMLTMDGEIEMKNNLKFNQGVGVGIDLDYILPISWTSDRRAFIRFEVKNLGFAHFYEKQKVYSFDTTITFDGFEFEELLGSQSFGGLGVNAGTEVVGSTLGLFGDSLDLLDTLGITLSEKNRTSMLPGFIQIGKIVDEHYEGQVQSFFGVRMYPSLIYNPYVFAGIDYKPTDWVRLGLSGSYGGFGKFRAGLYSNFVFGKYTLGVATENLIGLISRKGSGQSLFVKLRCVL